MNSTYLLRRFGLFLLVIWGAATLNFFLPRLAPGDPIAERMFAMSMQGGYTQTGVEEMVQDYKGREEKRLSQVIDSRPVAVEQVGRGEYGTAGCAQGAAQ